MPSGEGVVSITIYADGSWVTNLEMWGVSGIASLEMHMAEFELKEWLVLENNPDWLLDLRKLVADLNAVLKTRNKNNVKLDF